MSRNFMFSWYFFNLQSNSFILRKCCVLEEIHGHMTNCDAVKIHA